MLLSYSQIEQMEGHKFVQLDFTVLQEVFILSHAKQDFLARLHHAQIHHRASFVQLVSFATLQGFPLLGVDVRQDFIVLLDLSMLPKTFVQLDITAPVPRAIQSFAGQGRTPLQ